MAAEQGATTGDHLTESSVVSYLIDMGVLDRPDARVKPLSGGVSADVFAVDSGQGSWVVKQALPRLKVDHEWNASPSRAITEASALQVADKIIPGYVPPLILLDDQRMVVVTARAPLNLREWKTELMSGGSERSSDTSARLGEVLALLHSNTFHDASLETLFGDIGPFVTLRTDPFHHTVAEKYPDLSLQLEQLADELVTTPTCLVHGDFSPKNILSAGTELWILDWEVAHLGLPAFDVAFLLAHLVCKAIHKPEYCGLYRSCAETFLTNYGQHVRDELRLNAANVVSHTAAIVLARADGKSPAGYLTEPQRNIVRSVTRDWLTESSTPSNIVNYLWSTLP